MKTPALFDTPVDRLPAQLTDKDLAKYTPWSRTTYQIWRSKKKGPPYRQICGRIFYERDAVIKYFNEDGYTDLAVVA